MKADMSEDHMDLEALALAVDEQARVPAAERSPGRLYAVRCEPDGGGCAQDGSSGDDEPPPTFPASAGHAGPPPVDGVVLELLAEGEARTLPQKVRPPAGLRALALTSGVWAAPLEDDLDGRPPSRHPERRRAHLTVVVGRDADRDGVDVSVLRYGDGSPTVMRGGIGLIHQRMLRCWFRRPDAPWATRRRSVA
jgi:hypothetical protein